MKNIIRRFINWEFFFPVALFTFVCIVFLGLVVFACNVTVTPGTELQDGELKWIILIFVLLSIPQAFRHK